MKEFWTLYSDPESVQNSITPKGLLLRLNLEESIQLIDLKYRLQFFVPECDVGFVVLYDCVHRIELFEA